MVDYKKLYYELFYAMTDSLRIIMTVQRKTEDVIKAQRKEILRMIESGEYIVGDAD